MARTIKTIWIVNKYAIPHQYESRLRAIKFAHYLTQAGYKVIVFGSSIMHNMNINLINDGSSYIRRKYGDIDFVHINTKMYHKTAGLNRIISEFQFFYKLRYYVNKFEKPDCILETGGPLLTNPILRYAKKHKIPFINESLDVWPDDFVNFGLISAKNPIIKLLFAQSKYNCAKADALVYSWSGCYKYLKEKKWDKESGGPVDLQKVYYINNGVDLSDFNNWKNAYRLDDADLLSDYKKIVYLGSIRLVNNVMQLIQAAKLLSSKDVKILIYGDGDDREMLIQYSKQQQLHNVIFKEKWVDPKYVPFILSQSYVNILNYSDGFGKYGISSSKMFQYMASGRPIVCNIDIYDCPITKYKIGIAKHFDSSEEYAQGIESILSLPESEYKAMCKRAYDTANEFDYKRLTDKIINVINTAVQ